MRGWSIWPGEALPHTSGTGKLKRGEVAAWVAGNAEAPAAISDTGSVEDVIRKFAGGRNVDAKKIQTKVTIILKCVALSPSSSSYFSFPFN